VSVVITVEETDIIVGTLVVTVEEGWFVTVVGIWWGGFAVQGGQTKPPTSPGNTWTSERVQGAQRRCSGPTSSSGYAE